MASNMGTYDNNGAPARGAGQWPMPEPATSSEADSGNLAPNWPSGKSAAGSMPPVGANDGNLPDKLIG